MHETKSLAPLDILVIGAQIETSGELETTAEYEATNNYSKGSIDEHLRTRKSRRKWSRV